MKHVLSKWRLVVLLGIMALTLSACGGKPYLSIFAPQGENAQKLLDLIYLSTGIMAIVVVVVTILFIYTTLKFRRKSEDEMPEQVEGNHKLEIIWTVIPIILLIFLAVPTIQTTFALDVADRSEVPEDAVKVKVTAKLYWWEFDYEDEEVITSQDLVIPTGEKVYLELGAADVKHAFWVPTLAGKIDTNVEQTNPNYMWIDAKTPGVYYGKCTELCGPSHALMDFKVVAMEPADYQAWVENMKKPAPQPTTELAVQGQELFNNNCLGCHAVESSEKKPLAPSLSNFADRERIAGIMEMNKENLVEWLKDPESIKPGNLMTNKYPGIKNDQEIDALAEYLMTLTKE